MARMDHQRAAAEQRTRKALIAAAAADGPRTITSKHNGICTTCTRGYLAGTSIIRTLTGWAHAHCSSNEPDAATRLADRRARKQTTRT